MNVEIVLSASRNTKNTNISIVPALTTENRRNTKITKKKNTSTKNDSSIMNVMYEKEFIKISRELAV